MSATTGEASCALADEGLASAADSRTNTAAIQDNKRERREVLFIRQRHSESEKRVRHLHEPSDVGSLDIVHPAVVVRSVGYARFVNAVHDALQPRIHLLTRPGDPERVLALLQSGDRDATGVRRLARAEEDPCVLEHGHRILVARHVGAFRDTDAAVVYENPGILAVQLVLRGGREREIARNDPRALTGVIGRVREHVHVLADPAAADLFQVLDPRQLLHVDSVGVVNEAAGVGGRDRLRAEIDQLLDRVDRDIAGAGYGGRLAFHALVPVVQHVLHEIHGPVARRFGADQAAAVRQALARDHALELVPQALELTEQVSDLAGAYSDIPCRDVHVGPDVPVQLGHHRLAEPPTPK